MTRLKKSTDNINAVMINWLQGKDLNLRPPGYGPDELPTALPCDVITIIKSLSIQNQLKDVENQRLFFNFYK